MQFDELRNLYDKSYVIPDDKSSQSEPLPHFGSLKMEV